MDDEIEVLDLCDVNEKNSNEEKSSEEVSSIEKIGFLDTLVVSRGYWFVVSLTFIVIVVLFVMMFK